MTAIYKIQNWQLCLLKMLQFPSKTLQNGLKLHDFEDTVCQQQQQQQQQSTIRTA
jgi:hypothetical protein